jgi:hypothetical protein
MLFVRCGNSGRWSSVVFTFTGNGKTRTLHKRREECGTRKFNGKSCATRLVIQSIDAIENPTERKKRQAELVDVLTRKLEAQKNQKVSKRAKTTSQKVRR